MKMKKIASFAILLAIIANFCAIAYGNTLVHLHCSGLGNDLHICESVKDDNVPDCISIETSKTELQYIKVFAGIVYEIEHDTPVNYKCVVIEPKNRVQEARRIVEEEI